MSQNKKNLIEIDKKILAIAAVVRDEMLCFVKQKRSKNKDFYLCKDLGCACLYASDILETTLKLYSVKSELVFGGNSDGSCHCWLRVFNNISGNKFLDITASQFGFEQILYKKETKTQFIGLKILKENPHIIRDWEPAQLPDKNSRFVVEKCVKKLDKTFKRHNLLLKEKFKKKKI